jgi:hypothetical protein
MTVGTCAREAACAPSSYAAGVVCGLPVALQAPTPVAVTACLGTFEVFACGIVACALTVPMAAAEHERSHGV